MAVERLKEFRFRATGTFGVNHLNAAADGMWNTSLANVHKLQVTALDDSGLEQPGIEDETIQTRKYASPPPIPGLARGTVKVTTYLPGAYANVDPTPEMNMAWAILGGHQGPTNARSTTAGAAVDTTNIAGTSLNTYAVAGMMVLCGVKGDGRGGGEVKPINSTVDGGHIGLAVATAAAVDTDDPLVFGTAVFPDEDATQQYIDGLIVGHGTANQRQFIGAKGELAFSGLGVGELPKMDTTLTPADWRWCPSDGRASFTQGTAAQGGEPAFNKAIGLVHIGDNGDSTRTAFKCGEFSFNPGHVTDDVPEPSGINGLGAVETMPGAATLEVTVLVDEDAGLIDDFANQTAKTVIVQLGHTARRCVAFHFPKCYLAARPQPAALGNSAAMKLMFRCDESYVSGDDLQSAAWSIHQF